MSLLQQFWTWLVGPTDDRSMFMQSDPPPSPVSPTRPPVSWPTSDPATVLAATAWMEDRSGQKDGMQAVMNVVLNRVNNPRWWGDSIYTVCLKPFQFSSWNKGNVNMTAFLAMLKDGPVNPEYPEWEIAQNLAELAVKGLLPDMTLNADSYHSASSPYPVNAWPPENTVTFTGRWGGQLYYRLYLKPRNPNPDLATS
jgi:N-acetylmuramoyl-L-alanine amidase